jgi:hypothetical protein
MKRKVFLQVISLATFKINTLLSYWFVDDLETFFRTTPSNPFLRIAAETMEIDTKKKYWPAESAPIKFIIKIVAKSDKKVPENFNTKLNMIIFKVPTIFNLVRLKANIVCWFT